jgi:hypothetical protein
MAARLPNVAFDFGVVPSPVLTILRGGREQTIGIEFD